MTLPLVGGVLRDGDPPERERVAEQQGQRAQDPHVVRRQWLSRQHLLRQHQPLRAGSGDGGDDAPTREARQWINAVINDKNPCVLPEQAFCVTQILEGIYESAKTGDIYRFDK